MRPLEKKSSRIAGRNSRILSGHQWVLGRAVAASPTPADFGQWVWQTVAALGAVVSALSSVLALGCAAATPFAKFVTTSPHLDVGGGGRFEGPSGL